MNGVGSRRLPPSCTGAGASPPPEPPAPPGAEPPVAGGRYAELMVQAAHRLPAEDVAPVAAWYASRRPAPR